MDMSPLLEKPVCVTGATGYVAGWIVRRLLEAGVTVHAPIRSPDDAGKRAHLDALASGLPGSLRYFPADLLEEGSYDDAARGCGVVFHAASPFNTSPDDPQADLIDPAVKGTANVLHAAERCGTVERVVLTSSVAAMYTDAQDCRDAPGGRLTEDVWNTTASLDYQPYSLSKTLAERKAWEIAEAGAGFRLVVVNPSLVLGPPVGGRPTSESVNLMKTIAGGPFRFGAPRYGIGAVDVRDVAEAQIRAAVLPDAEGRHIVSGHDTDFLGIGRTLLEPYGSDYPIPKKPIPKPLLWLMAPLVPQMTQKAVTRNVDIPFRADNSKSREKLGMSYRPLAETTRDMMAWMIGEGMV